MNGSEISSIIRAFADVPDNVLQAGNEIMFELQGESVVVALRSRDGYLVVQEDDQEWRDVDWVARRLAKLPLLADRIEATFDDQGTYISSDGVMGSVAQNYDNDREGLAEVLLNEFLDDAGGLCTKVLYITSDAGEGKSTLINKAAVYAAKAYKRSGSGRLIVPIALGGRSFMRLDDVVIGIITNTLRFRHVFYDGFIELVKHGMIVPAFDGFEEMFVVGASGEGVSSLGNLISSLDSRGTLMVAARKAYYEIRNFSIQARLIDALGGSQVVFDHLQIQRWSRTKFLEYWEARGLVDGSSFYSEVSVVLGEGHPVLTRPYLVKRIADLASDGRVLSDLQRMLAGQTASYFDAVLNSIIIREIDQVWFDKEGEIRQPLISLEQHHDLLTEIALYMYPQSVIRYDDLVVITQAFCEEQKVPRSAVRQVVSRIESHPLLRRQPGPGGMLSFDHDEFMEYYYSRGVSRLIVNGRRQVLREVLSHGALTTSSLNTICHFVKGFTDANVAVIYQELTRLYSEYPVNTYSRDNLAGIFVKLLEGATLSGIEIYGVQTEHNIFESSSYESVTFRECIFTSAVLSDTTLCDCVFDSCVVDSVIVRGNGNVISNVRMSGCAVHCLQNENAAEEYYDPRTISRELMKLGIVLENERESGNELESEEHAAARAFFRIFTRATAINDSVIRMKMGSRSSLLHSDVLPELLRARIVVEMEYRGAGVDRRFRLGVTMTQISTALSASHGSFPELVALLKKS